MTLFLCRLPEAECILQHRRIPQEDELVDWWQVLGTRPRLIWPRATGKYIWWKVVGRRQPYHPTGTDPVCCDAFWTPGIPCHLQRMMNRQVASMAAFCAAKLADLVIFSNSWEEHLSHFNHVLTALRGAGLTVKPS